MECYISIQGKVLVFAVQCITICREIGGKGVGFMEVLKTLAEKWKEYIVICKVICRTMLLINHNSFFYFNFFFHYFSFSILVQDIFTKGREKEKRGREGPHGRNGSFCSTTVGPSSIIHHATPSLAHLISTLF